MTDNIREKFPIFNQDWKHPLAYLDTAASAQKPQEVIDAQSKYLASAHANIHRGAYKLSADATEAYEVARRKVAKLVNAPEDKNIVFTRSTTESINLVAYAYEDFLNEGDVILLSVLDHHSNIVPWQILAERKKLKVEFVDIDDQARLNLEDYKAKLQELKPKLVAITQHSNAFGTLVPIKEVTALAKEVGAVIVVDAAQSIAHQEINVQDLDCDFLAFSGHKLYGPTGVGVLYAKRHLLEEMKPFQGGGDMIKMVSTSGSTWAELPNKFEAGTPAIAEAIALGAAVDFVESIGFDFIQKHDKELTIKALEILNAIPEVEIYGSQNVDEQPGIIAFNLKGIHAHDFSTIADSLNVQFRAGFHCAMPALERLGLISTARISFGVYTVEQDLLQLAEAINKAKEVFKL